MDEYLEKLGYEFKDVVTGFRGIAESLNVDIYGCVQYLLRPPMKKDGSLPDGRWMDVTRCKQISSKRAMEPIEWRLRPHEPRVDARPAGPADKPLR